MSLFNEVMIAAVISVSALVLASDSARAHSQAPSEIGGERDLKNAVSFTQHKMVTITLGNISRSPQYYRIHLNGEYFDTTTKFAPGDFRDIKVPVRISEPNKPEVHNICSISGLVTDKFNVRICTKAHLVWIK